MQLFLSTTSVRTMAVKYSALHYNIVPTLRNVVIGCILR